MEPAQEAAGARTAIRSGWLRAFSSTGSIPTRDELGVPGDRRQALAVGDRRELAQQGRDVALVSGAAAAEDVRVDHDERLHAASSR